MPDYVPPSGPPRFGCNSNLKNHPVHAKIEQNAHGNNSTAEIPVIRYESLNWSKTEYKYSYFWLRWTNQDQSMMLRTNQDELCFI